MGNIQDNYYQINSIDQYTQQLIIIDKLNHPIYGQVFIVSDSVYTLTVTNSQNMSHHPCSLHVLIKERCKGRNPNKNKFLVIPQFTLLQQIDPKTLNQIISIMQGVSNLAIESAKCGWEMGIAWKRIGFDGQKWGVVGQKSQHWTYQQAYSGQPQQGIYLSPQQMLSLYQNKAYPTHNPFKTDIFAFGIILIEMLSKQNLSEIFDYKNFQVKLKPLLFHLNEIKKKWGNQLYQTLIGMVQIDQNERLDWQNILQKSKKIKSTISKGSIRFAETIKKLKLGQVQTTPKTSVASRHLRNCQSDLFKSKKQDNMTPVKISRKDNREISPHRSPIQKKPLISTKKNLKQNIGTNVRHQRLCASPSPIKKK